MLGGQISNTVPDGTHTPLFKLRSMSGYPIMRLGGPVTWKAIHQEQCAHSSIAAEVIATDECSKGAVSLHHKAMDLLLPDADFPIRSSAITKQQ